MDWVHVYYACYLVFQAAYCIFRHGDSLDVHAACGLFLPVFHAPMIGRIFGWW